MGGSSLSARGRTYRGYAPQPRRWWHKEPVVTSPARATDSEFLAQGQASQWGRGEKRERSNLRLRQFSVEPRHLHAAGREGGVPTLSRSVPAPGVRTVTRDRRVHRAN